MSGDQTVCIVDDDPDVRDSLQMLLGRSGFRILTFESARAFLQAGIKAERTCVLADIRMPEMDGLALQREINQTIPGLPVIIMTGHGDVPLAVQAMKAGAIEFLEKPFEKATLLEAIEAAFRHSKVAKELARPDTGARADRVLTEREKEVFDLLIEGHQNKMIAHKLGISARTVEVHRARVMEKLGARNLADLVKHSLSRRRT
ncbi:MAG TPA: response regulator [Rhizomicrobium sp.]|nr:response regulator [Rhizomicrobium sp.]